MLSKKDYRVIAKIINNAQKYSAAKNSWVRVLWEHPDSIVPALIAYFAEHNTNFDSDKFWNECINPYCV